MKIHFRSPKEQNPTQDNGMQVLYAPGKRLAFRLRWYLILFLILLPALWLAARYGLDMVRVEAPALVRLPTLEVRAMQPGQVSALHVQVGDHVQPGAPLVDLDNPQLRLRLALLQGNLAPAGPAPVAVVERNRQVLQQLVQRAGQRVRDVGKLVAQGAATRGELLEAQNALDSRESERLAFERSVAGGAVAGDDARYQRQQQLEARWLDGQLSHMNSTAPESGRVAEVVTAPGENVGPGTLLLRLERTGPAQLWVYLDPKDVAHSAIGSRLDVRLPDGSSMGATVINPAESANPLPGDLRKPFSSPSRGLMVLARFDEPLADQWRVDSLPVRVRFPHHWNLFSARS
ncbi:MAG TPA: HlyD family efflux transporter periplasmic adaptor subunit [Pseudomonas sp.]|uniref:HlyD family secretion protein n=1 Tax=Pseudomonas sp. TaxID=306 RepID=UPI002B481CB5|nr:HlyD family efflux transporter periplasmic adaptor subunit [Pseudomonas sp.]HKS12591.1 HlyD family efflux transporter periplasmic adaptor subunit [Pseudomonas sp.]